jgi:very-short-patch-repair endonuclease
LGEIDIHNIHPIYRHAVETTKLHDMPFQFREDTGSFETLIAISESGKYRSYHEKNNRTFIPFVPDIIDYKNKIIIEFEEETGNRRAGAKMARKGHGHEGDMPTKRDERRNEFYKLAGFTVLRIWESQFKNSIAWKIALTEFLFKCWRNQLTESMTVYNKIPNLE